MEDLSQRFSADVTQQVGAILDSMSSEFEGLKQWLEHRLTSFIDQEK
jgi:hypothetical protein